MIKYLMKIKKKKMKKAEREIKKVMKLFNYCQKIFFFL